MHSVTLSTGAKFEMVGRGSLLDAAALAGISLPYSCKTGRCSSCKCKVISGLTQALHPEIGLTDQEKDEGWILSCVRTISSDVTLPEIKTLPCRISHLHRLAPDVVLVQLRLPPAADFKYIPGQYIDVIGPNGVRRSYSLANLSTENKLLELHIRAVDGGIMSEYWFNQARVNDLLRLNGPMGTFFLRDTKNVDLIFLATGTGIAPVKAMLESLSDRTADVLPRSVTVFWGGRMAEDLYFDVSNLGVQLTYVPVLSRADEGWGGARGYVQHALLSKGLDLRNSVVYACGSKDMIDSARELLIKNGLPAQSYFSDAFVSSSY
jgi:CDP-4-dehydro-6-deoxyglucose reductase